MTSKEPSARSTETYRRQRPRPSPMPTARPLGRPAFLLGFLGLYRTCETHSSITGAIGRVVRCPSPRRTMHPAVLPLCSAVSTSPTGPGCRPEADGPRGHVEAHGAGLEGHLYSESVSLLLPGVRGKERAEELRINRASPIRFQVSRRTETLMF